MLNHLSQIFAALALLGSCLTGLFYFFSPPPAPTAWLLPVGLLLLGGLIPAGKRGKLRLAAFIGCTLFLALAFFRPLGPDAGRGQQPAGDVDKRLLAVQLEIPAALSQRNAPAGKSLRIGPGLTIRVFAAGLEGPRMLAFSPAGDLYASLPALGRVVVLPDRDGDGVADGVEIFAKGLNRPHGLAFAGEDLIVAEDDRLTRLPDRDENLVADRVEVLSTDIPGGGGHWTRSVAVGPDGDLFVSAGSSCNVCIEEDPRRAAILHFGPEGGKADIYARGLRNSVGLAFHPKTGDLWASDNGRDWLGDNLPPEEINRIAAGGDYGWPFCYGQRIADPDFGRESRCRKTRPPEVEMQAHSAPLGIAFGMNLAFPRRYQNMLYVAFHGSWNRRTPTGYKLVGIPFRDGRPAGPVEDIVSGWLRGTSAWGRPVAPAAGPDGALYLSDDRAGVIYRISAPTNP